MKAIGILLRSYAPLLFIPLSLFLDQRPLAAPPWVFLCGLIAIGVLANWVRKGTEQVAAHAGTTIGSLLNVSFGNAAELVLALFVLSTAQTQVVQAQITGSIIGTTLLFLGVAAMVGGMRPERQTFSQEHVGLLSTLLLLLAVAIVLPAIFHATELQLSPAANLPRLDEKLSLSISVVLLLLYGAHLVYVLVTHRSIFEGGREVKETAPEWSLPVGLAVMIAATVGIAFEADLVSARLAETASQIGLSPVFMGVVVLALIGTISDLFVAVSFARAGKMDIVISLCLGSAIQIAMVVAPILVLVSWFIGHPMNLVFGSPLDLFAIVCTAFIVRFIVADGETTWYEGFLLIGVYVLFALAYFFLGRTS
jgi:Ca2+:H+ antiporter